MRRSCVGLVLLAMAALLVPAAPAAAVRCNSPTLTDAEGIDWLAQTTIEGLADNADAYRSLIEPYFTRGGGMDYDLSVDQNADGCTFEQGDRELRFPVIRIGDLDVSGTWYVPSGAPAFQRSLLILSNPHAEPAALPPFFSAATEWGAGTRVVTSSNGDGEGTAADDWITLENSADAADPRVGFLWNLGSGDRRRSAAELYDDDDAFAPRPFRDGDDTPQIRWDRIVVPPGGMVTFFMVGLTRSDSAATEAALRELQAAPDVLLAGLSDAEKRALQNVGLPDRDLDGAANGADNCPDVVNGDQANLDGDGQGDACDDDVDGDGVANLAETARGTDPRNADSDGDGRRDAEDVCPTRAGAGADGCPRFDTTPPAADTAAPGVTIRRLGARMRLRAFRRRGVPCVVDLTEAATVVCRLLVRARGGARIAAAGDLELARRSLPLGAGRRSVRLKPRRGLVRQRRFRATLQVTAVDAAGNRGVATKRFGVR